MSDSFEERGEFTPDSTPATSHTPVSDKTGEILTADQPAANVRRLQASRVVAQHGTTVQQ